MNKIIQEPIDFIGLYQLEDKTITNGIVEFFENNPNLHHDGVSAAGRNNEIVRCQHFIILCVGRLRITLFGDLLD